MTFSRSSFVALVAVLTACTLAARADTFSFSANGAGGGFSGSGTLTTTLSAGDQLITGITGTGVTSLIAPGGFNGNDNLLFPSSDPVLDSHGFSFTDVNGPDHYNVNIFSSGTGYFAFLQDEDDLTQTVPITFELTTSGTSPIPEPSSLLLMGTGLLGAVTALRRRRAVRYTA